MWWKFIKVVPWKNVANVTPQAVNKVQQIYREKIKRSAAKPDPDAVDYDAALVDLQKQISKLQHQLIDNTTVIEMLQQQNQQLIATQKKLAKWQLTLSVVLAVILLGIVWFVIMPAIN